MVRYTASLIRTEVPEGSEKKAVAFCLLVAALVAAGLLLSTKPAHATNYTVTKPSDTNDGACSASDCSLREAIIAANASAADDMITVPAGTYKLGIGGTGEDAATTGDLDITNSGKLTITGADARKTIIDGNAVDRVFNVLYEASATISGVAIRNGNPGGVNGGSGGEGGGILSGGALTIIDVTLSGNTSTSAGGGIYSFGPLYVKDSTFSANSSYNAGGGIFSYRTTTITNSTFSSNQSTGNRGGGVGVSSLDSPNEATLKNSTFNGNHATYGGSNILTADAAQVTLKNTILASNTALSGTSCGELSNGKIVSQGFNLEYPGNSCNLNKPSDKPDTAPRLGLLKNNGGPTDTHALLKGSPAINAGGKPFPPKDQRGVKRPQGKRSDIGAYEKKVRRR